MLICLKNTIQFHVVSQRNASSFAATTGQDRSSTKILGGAKVSKKCPPPWLTCGESFRF